MRFTIDRINDLLKHYGGTPLASAWGHSFHGVLNNLDTQAGIRTDWYTVGTRIKMHEDHIEFGLPYFWLGREAEENR